MELPAPEDLRVRRVQDSVAYLLREGDAEVHTGTGTGVYVRIGGRGFVFTAGHVVWNGEERRPYRFTVGAPGDEFAGEQKFGDGSAGQIFIPSTFDEDGNPDPDVAVIELTDKAILRPDCKPYDEDSIGFFGSDAPTEQLLLAGFPDEMILEHERIDRGPFRSGLRRLDLYLSGMDVHTMPRIRWPEEPPEGRGVHVFISPQAEDRKHGGVTLTPAPEGTSGGPLARHDGRLLVGLARGCVDFEDGLDQWCEPVVEAVRLLLRHRDRKVAAAARRIIRRCARIRTMQGHGRKR